MTVEFNVSLQSVRFNFTSYEVLQLKRALSAVGIKIEVLGGLSTESPYFVIRMSKLEELFKSCEFNLARFNLEKGVSRVQSIPANMRTEFGGNIKEFLRQLPPGIFVKKT